MYRIFYGLIVLYDDLGVNLCVTLVCLLYVSLVAYLALDGSYWVFLHKIYDASHRGGSSWRRGSLQHLHPSRPRSLPGTRQAILMLAIKIKQNLLLWMFLLLKIYKRLYFQNYFWSVYHYYIYYIYIPPCQLLILVYQAY